MKSKLQGSRSTDSLEVAGSAKGASPLIGWDQQGGDSTELFLRI
jgi:hypothetical protein